MVVSPGVSLKLSDECLNYLIFGLIRKTSLLNESVVLVYVITLFIVIFGINATSVIF